MRRPRGFALAAVLSALVIMAMVVAMSAQRALLAARQGALDVARADMAAAIASGQAAALETPPDSAGAVGMIPGAALAAGEVSAGAATAHWSVVVAGAPFATIDVSAEAPVFRGTTRELRRAIFALARDSIGGLRWVPAGGGGWVRLPSP